MSGTNLRPRIRERIPPVSPQMVKSRTRPKPQPAAAPSANADDKVVELEIERYLRVDLKLSSVEIAEIDVPLAIDASLIKKPRRT